MKKDDFLKLLFIIIPSIIVCATLINFFKLFSPSEKTIISKAELSNIKTAIISEIPSFKEIKLTAIEGNKQYVALSFVNIDSSNAYETANVLYSTKENKIISSVGVNDINISLLDTGFIKYVGDNRFLALDSSGYLYNVDMNKENDIKIRLIQETGIKKDKLFKYLLKDKSLYIISRDTLSKYNEKILTNNNVLELKFKNNKFNKADTITYKFNESDFIYSFALDSEGNVGIVGSNHKEVLGETVNLLSLPSDENYISSLPSEDKNYKFVDTSSIWVRFLHDDSILNIDESNLNLEYYSIHNLINKKVDLNINSPSNVPVFIGDGFTVFSEFKYEALLYNLPFLKVANAIRVNHGSGLENETIASIRNTICWFNHKPNKYVGFFFAKDSLVGINKNGETFNIFASTIGFPYKNEAIFLEEDAIKFKKI